jgi:hypothetical protein
MDAYFIRWRRISWHRLGTLLALGLEATLSTSQYHFICTSFTFETFYYALVSICHVEHLFIIYVFSSKCQ